MQEVHSLRQSCRPYPWHGGVLERVPMALYSSELYLCSSELYLWTGVIFYKYIFLFCKFLLLWWLVFLCYYFAGEIIANSAYWDYTLANICAKFQSSRLLFICWNVCSHVPKLWTQLSQKCFFPTSPVSFSRATALQNCLKLAIVYLDRMLLKTTKRLSKKTGFYTMSHEWNFSPPFLHFRTVELEKLIKVFRKIKNSLVVFTRVV